MLFHLHSPHHFLVLLACCVSLLSLAACSAAVDTSAREQTSGRCPSCVDNWQRRQMYIDSLRRTLLHRLDVQEPRVTGSPAMARKVREEFEGYGAARYDRLMNDIQPGLVSRPDKQLKRVWIEARRADETGRRGGVGYSDALDDNILHFDVNKHVQSSGQLERAVLLVHKQASGRATGSGLLQVQLLKRVFDGNNMIMKEVYDTIQDAPHDHVTIDIGGIVRDWIRWPQTNLGLEVRVLGLPHEVSAPRFVHQFSDVQSDEDTMPIVELHLRESSRRRRSTVRDGAVCRQGSTERRCCRYPLEINFSEIGLPFVVAPEKYSGNYCAGECDWALAHRQPHTHLAMLANNTKSCCAPVRMRPMQLIYWGSQNSINFAKIDDMYIESCGCV